MENVINITLDKLKNSRGYLMKTLRIAVFGIRNNLVLAGILMFSYCVIAPVFSFVLMDSWSGEGGNIVNQGLGVFSIVGVCITGILVPGTLFNFVHHRRDSDFYNAMPVRRGQYFIGYGISGFVLFFVPYLLMCVIHALIGSTFGAGSSAFLWFWHFVAVYIIVYSSMVFAMMFSGSLLSALITFALMNSFMFVLLYCSIHMGWRDLDTNAYDQLIMPYYLVFMPVSSAAVASVNGYFDWIMIVQLVIAAMELALSYLMYKLRRGETTMAVAFPKTRYILQYSVMFVITWFTYTLFINASSWRGDGTVTAAATTAIVGIATFVIMNMVLEQSFRAAFHRIRHLFIFTALFIAAAVAISVTVSALPRHIIPMRADALRVMVTYHEPVKMPADYDPETDDSDYDGRPYSEVFDYQGGMSYFLRTDHEEFIVTDRAQVDYMVDWMYEHIDNYSRYSPYANDSLSYENGYYEVHVRLLALKPGTKLVEGTTTYKAYEQTTWNFDEYFYFISPEDVEYFRENCRAYTEKSGRYALYGNLWQIEYDYNVDDYKYGNGVYDYDDWRDYANQYYYGTTSPSGGHYFNFDDSGTEQTEMPEETTMESTQAVTS